MRLALIPPISLLEYTAETDMQLMLPHLIDNITYNYTYSMHCKDPNQFVILDNGEAEGVTADPDRLMEVADAFNVDEVVAPDVIGVKDATISKTQLFIEGAEDTYEGIIPWSIMFVAQGQTLKEVKESIDWAMQWSAIRTIGLPRHLPKTTQAPSARKQLADWFDKEHGNEEVVIHLLGGSPEHCTELRDYRWPAIVRSTDTSAPFNYAWHHKSLRRGNVYRRPVGYFDEPAYQFTASSKPKGRDAGMSYLEYNIRNLMEWTGNGE